MTALRLLALSVLACGAAAAQTWQPADGPAGATYRSPAGATLHVLTLEDADVLTGYDLSDLEDDYAEMVIDYVLDDLGLALDTEDYDLTDPTRPTVEGVSGGRRVAAGMRGTGAGRRVVVLVADARAYDAAGGRRALEVDVASSSRAGAPVAQTPSTTRYRAPSTWSDAAAWPERGAWKVQEPGAPSPRWARLEVGLSAADYSAAGAASVAFRRLGVEAVGALEAEVLEAWRRIDRRERTVGLVPTRLGGQPAVAFVLTDKIPGSITYTCVVLEAPLETFVAWGGITRMLTLQDVTPSTEVFPESRRGAIARSSLRSQVDLYETVADALYAELAAGATMTQGAVSLRMLELNYDLILGGDISSPFIAD